MTMILLVFISPVENRVFEKIIHYYLWISFIQLTPSCSQCRADAVNIYTNTHTHTHTHIPCLFAKAAWKAVYRYVRAHTHIHTHTHTHTHACIPSRAITKATVMTPHENIPGIQRVSNPSTGNQRIRPRLTHCGTNQKCTSQRRIWYKSNKRRVPGLKIRADVICN